MKHQRHPGLGSASGRLFAKAVESQGTPQRLTESASGKALAAAVMPTAGTPSVTALSTSSLQTVAPAPSCPAPKSVSEKKP